MVKILLARKRPAKSAKVLLLKSYSEPRVYPSLSVLVPQSPETLLRKTRNKKESNDVSCYLSGRHSSYWSGLRVVYTCTDCAGRGRYNTTGHYHTDADQDVRRHSLG